MPLLWAVPRLLTFVNYTSITSEGSEFLTPASVQHRVVVHGGQDSPALGIEILVLTLKTCSCRHGFILCHVFTDREAFPMSLSPRAHEQILPDWNGGTSMTELLFCSPRHICLLCYQALLAITITAAEIPFWDQKPLWNCIYLFILTLHMHLSLTLWHTSSISVIMD